MQKQAKEVLLLIPLVVMFSFALDSYIPFLLEIKSQLKMSTATAQMTLSAYFLAIACGQILLGIISDIFGRLKTLYLSVIIFIIASFFCAISTSAWMLITFRFFQGFGAAGLRLCAYAMVKDRHDDKQAATYITHLFGAISISPMVAPLVGGFIGTLFGWRATFIFIILCGIGCIFCITRLKESITIEKIPLKQRMRIIFTVFYDRHVLFFGLISASGISVLFSFASVINYVIIDQYRLSHYYIYISFIIAGLGMFFAGKISAALSDRFGIAKTIALSFTLNWLLLVIIGLLMAFHALTLMLFYILIDIMLINGIIINGSAIVLGVAKRKNATGVAISVIGALGYGIASINGWLLSYTSMDMGDFAMIIGGFYTLIILLALSLYFANRILASR